MTIKDDIAAIEAALAAGPTAGEWTIRMRSGFGGEEYASDLNDASGNRIRMANITLTGSEQALKNDAFVAAANPARLRRILDTMAQMGEAISNLLAEKSAAAQLSDACLTARAALAKYRGEA